MVPRLGIQVGLAAGLLASSLVGRLGSATAHAQEIDGCTSSAPPCARIESFNFTDPGTARNTRHLLRGDMIFISRPDMEMIATPMQRPAEGASSSSRVTYPQRGDYTGANARELYCIVFARGC